jgi:hypothetical protein
MKRKMGRESTFHLLESVLLVSYWQAWAFLLVLFCLKLNVSTKELTITDLFLNKKFWEESPTHRKRSIQQFIYCCMCIQFCGNVFTKPLPSNDGDFFTKPLPSNDKGIFTEPLPNDDREIHILMGGIF